MHEGSSRLGFPLESLDVVNVSGQVRFEDFESHVSFQRFLDGQVDVGHATGSQSAKQIVVTDLLPGKVGAWRGCDLGRRRIVVGDSHSSGGGEWN